MKKTIKHNAAWLCIVSQLLPAVSFAVPTNSELSLQEQQTLPLNNASKPYILTAGDTIETVAKRFNVTVSELKKYNQFRMHSKSFEKLGPGDEIDVPVDNKHPNVLSPTPQKTSPKENELFWANSASTAGSILSADDSQSAAANMAKSIASQAASQSLSEWFSGFGTARINLGLDDHYRLDGSSIDFLTPIYEIEKSIIFTQLGVRDKDSRTTLNMGLGARYFTDTNWMFGGNMFFDNDITGKNKRLGLGAEAWTDYLKLSANSYHPITDWHQSRDFADYDERPARGYDLRAEAYVPYYPQLGGKLFYEKYFGDEVALFGKDKRQKDPYGVVAGLSYTPFPLLTASLEQRLGNSHDTQLTLGLSYKIGTPLNEQLSSESVGKVRTLAGSKLDLIERNNNIVLEYKKQDIINLNFQYPTITGKVGEKIKVQPTVSSKYGLKTIEWDAPELIAAGGKLETVSPNTLLLTLPTKISLLRSALVSQYTLGAIAYDNKGNRTNRITTDIIVSDPEVQLDSTNLSMTHDKAIANGADSNTVKAVLIDATGEKVSGVVVSFSADDKRVNVVTPSVTSDENGVAETQMTSIAAGSFPITATIVTGGKEVSKSVDATFIADAANATLTDLTLVSPNNVFADGKDIIQLQAKVADSNGNPVENQTVGFSTGIVNGVILDPTVATTDENGIASTRISSTQIQTILVTATVKNSASVISQKTVDTTFIDSNSPPDVKQSKLYAEPTAIMASTTTPSTITLELKDKYGNLLKNRTVDFTSDQNDTTTLSPVMETNGVYTSQLTATTPGKIIVSAKVNGENFDVGTTEVIVTAGLPSFSHSQWTITQTPIIANGNDFATATLKLFDANDNRVEGVKNIVFKTSGEVGEQTLNAVESAPGVYTVELKGTKAGDAFVTASVPGLETFELLGFKLIADISTVKGDLKAQSPKTVVSQYNTISLELSDNKGNPLVGLANDLEFYATDENGTTITEGISFRDKSVGQSDGKYTIVLSGTRAQVLYIRAKLNGVSIRTPDCVVAIIPGTINTVNSKLNAPSTLVANTDGGVTLTLKDAFNNNVIADNAVEFVVDGPQTATLPATLNAQGEYTATFNAGQNARTATILAKVGGQTVQTATVIITADVSSVQATAKLNYNEIIANQNDSSTLTITLSDKYGNPLDGQTLSFVNAETSSDITKTEFVDNKDGTYTSLIKGVIGKASTTAKPISVQFGGAQKVSESITLIADTSSLDANRSTLEIKSNPITAGDQTDLVLTIKDRFDNLASDESVEFRTIANGTCTAQKTKNDGEYVCTLTGKVVGTETVYTFISSGQFNVSAQDLIIKASTPIATKSSLTARSTEILDSSSTELTLTLRDDYNNPVTPDDMMGITDLTELFTSNSAATTFTDVKHKGLGVYTVTFSSTVLGDIKVKSQYMNKDVSNEVTVRVVANSSDISTVDSTLTLDPQMGVAGISQFTATLRLVNNNKNPINIANVSFNISIGDLAFEKPAINNGDGTYSVSVSPSDIGYKSGSLTAVALVKINPSVTASVKTVTSSIKADIGSAVAESKLSVDSVIANDTDFSVLTVSLKDQFRNPIIDANLVFTPQTSNNVTTTTFVNNNDGTYTSKVRGRLGTASQAPQKLSISFDGGTEITATSITLIADTNALEASLSTLAIVPNSIIAGKSPTVLTATIKDNLGNPANNESVVFRTMVNGFCEGQRTQNDGEYSCELVGYVAGADTVSVFIANRSFGLTGTLTITADTTTPTAIKSTLTIDKRVVVANAGSDVGSANVTLKLGDAQGNPLSGMPVVFSSLDAIAGSLNIQSVDNGNGTYTAKISGNALQTVNIQAKVEGNITFIPMTVQLSFTADSYNLDVNTSRLTITPSTITAGTDVNKGAVVTLVLYDIYGNKVDGNPTINFNSLLLGSSFNSQINSDGNSFAQVTSTLAGNDTITAIVNGTSFKSVSLVVTGDVSTITTNSTLALTKNNIPADGASSSQIQLKLLDNYNNPVTGQTVIFTSPNSSGVNISNVTYDSNGIYTASVNGIIPGTYRLTATVQGNPEFSMNVDAIFTNAPMPAGTNINAGGVLFGLASGFPSTAFYGAKFQIQIGGVTSNNQNFAWSSSHPTVASVDATGTVTILNKPAANTPVLISARNPVSQAEFIYTITPTLNYFTAYSAVLSWSQSVSQCSFTKQLQPTQSMITSGTNARLIGSLFGEWGNLHLYPTSSFVGRGAMWSSTADATGNHAYIVPTNGQSLIDGDSTARGYAICYK